MTPELQRALMKHQEKAMTLVRSAGADLARAAVQSRGELSTALLRSLVPVSVAPVRRSQFLPSQIARQLRTNPQLSAALYAAEGVLRAQAAALIRAQQRRFYAQDQKARAGIYQKHTPEFVNVQFIEPTVVEIEELWALPLEGRTLDEWMAQLAAEARNSILAAITRALSGEKSKGGTGPGRLAGAINRAYAEWLRLARKVASMALSAAMGASSREVTAAFAREPVVTS